MERLRVLHKAHQSEKRQGPPTPITKILSPDMINKITAGEVLKCSVSIVKEAIKYEFESLSDFISNT